MLKAIVIVTALLAPSVAMAETSSLADQVFGLAEEHCDRASQDWLESGLTEAQVGGWSGMYEACMRLSVPVWVTGLPPAQHYDTTDGAFWRVAP